MKDESFGRFSEPMPFRDDKNLAVFFQGDAVAVRMSDVRQSIHYVRDHWYSPEWTDEMLEKLCREYTIPIDKSILRQKNWLGEKDTPDINKFNFDLVKYYTTKDGYKNLRGMNDVFREKELDTEKCNLATFLVELINIELYNYINTMSDANNFEGTIYRGFSPKGMNAAPIFEEISKRPVQDRQIAIPLEFMSASRSRNVAMEYARKSRNNMLQAPVIMEIHVRNLNPEFIDTYHSFYSDSPVTSLCSVPIEKISSNPDDKEVLLRGAFFQVLNSYTEGEFTYVKAVMINANRDHIRTHKYKDTNAQSLFGKLVKLDKMRICKELSDNEKDRKTYAELEKQAQAEVEQNIEISKKDIGA